MKFRKGDVVRNPRTGSEGVVIEHVDHMVSFRIRDYQNQIYATAYINARMLDLVKRKPRVIQAAIWNDKREVPKIFWGIEMPNDRFAPFPGWRSALKGAVDTAKHGGDWSYVINYERIAQ